MAKCAACDKNVKSKLNAGKLCDKCFNKDATQSVNTNDTNDVVNLDKSVAEITVRELLELIKQQTDPIENRLTGVETGVTKIKVTIDPIENRVTILEKELENKTEKIDTLTGIIVNMQKALNMIDFEKRATNVMISSVSEEDIIVKDQEREIVLKNDMDKVEHILEIIGCSDINTDQYEITRIGRPKQDMTRMIRINTKPI